MYSKSSIIKFLQGDAGTQCSMPRLHVQSPREVLGDVGTQCSMPRLHAQSPREVLGDSVLNAQTPCSRELSMDSGPLSLSTGSIIQCPNVTLLYIYLQNLKQI